LSTMFTYYKEERLLTLMNDFILQDFTPSRIQQAIDDYKIADGTLFSTLPHAVLHNDPGICWFETGIPLGLFNGVLHTDLPATELPQAIERIKAHFEQRHQPFMWHVGPTSQPANLGDFLQAQGIAHDEDEDEPGMAADLLALNEDLPVSSSLVMQQVTSREQVKQWAEVWGCGVTPDWVVRLFFSAQAGLPLGPESPLRMYLGLLDGVPVATVAIMFGGGVACIKHVVTLHRVRRQGIGAAMTLMAAREARKQGYRIAVLSASPFGIGIYRRLGFQEYCKLSTYEWKPASNQDQTTSI
jgi:ribosomal protein S18 acetylase RimI-like enzyme